MITPTKGNSTALRTLLLLACLVIVLAGVKAASAIVVPFVLSLFIAIICNPLIRSMERIKIPKIIAVLVVMLVIVLVGLWVASIISTSINQFSHKIPEYRVQLADQFGGIVAQLQTWNINISKAQLLSYFDPAMALSMTNLIIASLGNVMTNLFLIILTVVFMLFEAPDLPKKIHFALDDPDMRLKQIDRFFKSVNQYMLIKTLVSIATAVVVSVGLMIIGVDYILLWAVIAFLFNYIPNIGSIIAAIPAMLLALIQLGPMGMLATGGVYLVANVVMGNFIEPRFMGKGLGLSTLIVFLSLIFWGWLLGSVGMLLSVPLTMIVKIGLESSATNSRLAVLLADDVHA